MAWITLLLLTVLSALLYRMGGMGDTGRKEFPWLPKFLFNTKARDVGCALVTYIGMIVMFDNPWWAHLLSGLLLFGALTTYWDFLFGYDEHFFHGFMCGLAYFPYAIASGNWVGLVARVAAVTIIMGLVSLLSSDDDIEEFSRGAALPLTLPLLFI